MSAMTTTEYDASVRTLMMEIEHPLPDWLRSISHMLDLSLLKNRAFILYATASFLNMLGEFCKIVFNYVIVSNSWLTVLRYMFCLYDQLILNI
jgi:hypothetical protein